MTMQPIFKFMSETKARLISLETKQGKRTAKSVGLAIVAGAIIVDYREFYRLVTESGLTDDLTTITGGEDGYLLTVMNAVPGQTITAKTGIGNLRLNGDCVLSTVDQSLTLRFNASIGYWVEIARSLTSGGGGGGSGTSDALLSDGSVPLHGNLSVDNGITIDGIDISAHAADPDAHHPRATALNASMLVNPTTQTVAVNQAYGFSWTTQHTFSAGLLATHVGAVDSLLLDPTNDLTINPGNKVYLQANKEIRTTDWVSGFLGAGWGITNILGASLLDIRKIQVEELHAYVFISDIERVRVGETFVTQSMGILKHDMVTPSIGGTTYLWIEDIPQAAGAAFLNNEWVLMQLIDRSGGGITIGQFWGQVSGYTDGTGSEEGNQRYIYTHRHGAVGATIKEGSYVLSFGLSGDGYIHESVIDSAGSPYTRYATWVTDPSIPANRTVHVQIGNLNSVTDIDLNPNGWGLYADNVFLNGDLLAGNGAVRLTADGINIQQADWTVTTLETEINWWENVDVISGNPTFTIYSSRYSAVSEDRNVIEAYPSTGMGETSIRLSAFRSTSYLGGNGGEILITGGSSTVGSATVALVAEKISLTTYDSLSGNGVYVNNNLYTTNIIPQTGSLHDIGTASKPIRTLYVDTIIASAITSGAALSGQTWQFDPGDMFIKSSSSSTRTLYVANPGSGVMNLDVDGTLTVAGNINGFSLSTMNSTLSSLNASFTSHTADINAHHNKVHVLATTSALGPDHTVSGLTGGQVLKALTATSAGFVQLNHSELGGLTASDDHPQYVHISTARTISAVHTFTPGTATAPFILGANGQGQTVVGLKADQLNKTVTAGVGLSGGGALTAGITVSMGTPSTLTLATTNSATGTTHTHAITTSSNPGASASILASTVSGGLTLQTVTLNGTGVVLSSASGTLSMADNVNTVHKLGMLWLGEMGFGSAFAGIANRYMATTVGYALIQSNTGATFINAPTGQSISHRINNADVMVMGVERLLPAGSGDKSLGDYNRKWSELFASQLIVDNLVASNVMATIGGRIMVAPTAKLTRDITAATDTIYLDSNLAVPLQVLFMEGLKGGVPQNEHMRVVSGPYAAGTGEWAYEVQRHIRNQDNLITNPGFESISTTGWSVLPGGPGVSGFTTDNFTPIHGSYYGVVYTVNSPGNYSGVYTSFSATAGTIYTVSVYVRTNGVSALNIDAFDGLGLDTTSTIITGTTGTTRYTFSFTAPNTATVQIRFFDANAIGGTFDIDELIVEKKYGINGFAWYIDDANVNLGYTKGSGYIDLTSLTTAQGHYGPTMTVYAHVVDGGEPKPTVSVGNLRSFVDYTTDTMGFAVGNDLTLTPTGGFTGLTGDATNGLRLFNVTQKFYTSGVERLRLAPSNGITFANMSGSPALENALAWYRNGVGTTLGSTDLSTYLTAYTNSGGNVFSLFTQQGPSGTSQINLLANSETLYHSAITIVGDRTTTTAENGQVAVTAKYIGLAPTANGTNGLYMDGSTVFVGPTGFSSDKIGTFSLPSSGLALSGNWQNIANSARSEIASDLNVYKELMLAGNSSAGGSRRVGVYDQLQINGSTYQATLNINGVTYMVNSSTPGTPTGGGFLYVSAGALWFKGSSGTNTKLANA